MGQLARHEGRYPSRIDVLSAQCRGGGKYKQENALVKKLKPPFNAKTSDGNMMKADGGPNLYSMSFDAAYTAAGEKLVADALQQLINRAPLALPAEPSSPCLPSANSSCGRVRRPN